MMKDKIEYKRNEDRLTIVTDEGRVLELWNVEIVESIQDEGKTLKLFVKKKREQLVNPMAELQKHFDRIDLLLSDLRKSLAEKKKYIESKLFK